MSDHTIDSVKLCLDEIDKKLYDNFLERTPAFMIPDLKEAGAIDRLSPRERIIYGGLLRFLMCEACQEGGAFRSSHSCGKV